jgi:signal transduction histidine kinase
MLGFNKLSEIVSKNIGDFLVGGIEKANEITGLLKKEGKINRYKAELVNNKCKKIVVSLGVNQVKWEDELLYFDGTIEDITKQQQYEDALILAKEKAEESDKLKTEFLAGMSHEIRTPVNTIMSYLSLLDNELNEEDALRFKEVFDAIQIGSLRLTRTIDSILNMAQFQAGTFDVFKTKIDINNDIIKNLFEEFKYVAKQRGLELRYLNNSKNTSILGDKYSISQLFVNLLDNGLKYTKEGYVEIKIYNNEDGALCTDIKDSGIGISSEFLPTLFQPFSQEEQGYTRKFDGNGLGLALVKKYCDLNDATIKVSSAKGEGTKFTVKFTQTNNKNEYQNVKEQINEQI